MPVILVATDFSAAGENAGFYGAALAQAWGYELSVLHTYFLPVTFNDPAMPIIPMEEMQEVNVSRMSKTEAALKESFPELNISTRIEYGEIQDTLEDVLEEVKPGLLVIGSHGEDEDTFWTGNTSAALLRNSKTPILAVPAGYAFQPITEVCIALDKAGLSNDDSFKSLQELLTLTKAGLHVLHVVKEVPIEDNNQPTTSFPALADAQKVAFHVAKAQGSIDDEIAGFIAANHIDWLVVVPHHYTFWESIFHKSHTKAMVHKSGVPILALH